MTSSVVGLRRSPQALPKAKLASQKVMVTVWCSAAHLIHQIHYSFFSPGKTIISEQYAQQIEEMHQKLQQAFVKRMGQILPHDNA